MTLDRCRSLVAEVFVVETPEQADDILCAVLRVENLGMISGMYQGEGELATWVTEERVRRRLASTRALFGRAFKMET